MVSILVWSIARTSLGKGSLRVLCTCVHITVEGMASQYILMENASESHMKVLFLHGGQSVPGGVNPTCLQAHGYTVINPKIPDDNMVEAVRIIDQLAGGFGTRTASYITSCVEACLSPAVRVRRPILRRLL